jgi:hypothetical protein
MRNVTSYPQDVQAEDLRQLQMVIILCIHLQMMNVEGLTRENVASHLQKFRLQLKRENRLDEEGNLISPLKGSKLAGSEEDARGSATSADRDDGAGAKGSTPSSHPVGVSAFC